MIIESGATVNRIDQTTCKTINNAPPLISTTTKIFSYQSDHPVDLLGHFITKISCNNKAHQSRIYLVKETWGSLLGKIYAEALDVWCVGPLTLENVAHLDTTNDNIPSSTKSIVSKYSSVFYGTDFLKSLN